MFPKFGSHTLSSSTFSINGKTYFLEVPTDPGGGGGGEGGLEPKISHNKQVLGREGGGQGSGA